MTEVRLKIIKIEPFFNEKEIDLTDRVKMEEEDGWHIEHMAITPIPKGALGQGDRYPVVVTILLSRSTITKTRLRPTTKVE